MRKIRQREEPKQAAVLKLVATLTLIVALGGCAVSSIEKGKTDAAVRGVNYTNDYVDFTLMSTSGINLGTGGSVEPFPKGGAGGSVCCAMVPGVGQTVRIEFRIGGFGDAAGQYKTYSRDVVVTGTMPSPKDELQSYLIVRFFPAHEVEAELIPSTEFEPKNPRVDKLFSGKRIMRQIGE
jgi:hypothetical protein